MSDSSEANMNVNYTIKGKKPMPVLCNECSLVNMKIPSDDNKCCYCGEVMYEDEPIASEVGFV